MGAAAPPGSSLNAANERVVEYERELSVGAVGTIWLGRLSQGTEQGRLVQVRRVSCSLVSGQARERLRQVSGHSARLRHPDVLKHLGTCEEEGELLCISEHLQCVLLVHLQRMLLESETPMPTAVAVRIVRDAARAGTRLRVWAEDLGIFSEQRLLYADNLTVAAYGETLLRDVGVITALCQSPLIVERPGVIAGLSPEELSGPRVMHESSEVFTLGVLLWELLANRLLFSRRDAERAMSSVVSQPIPQLSRVQRAGLPVPDELVALILRAVDRDPRRRLLSLEAFADQLDELPAYLIGSIDQVGNCIRRLAGGNLGESSESRTWPVGSRDSSANFDGTSVSSRSFLTADFEPETLANRRLLASSLVVPKARPSSRAASRPELDIDVMVELPRRRQGARLAVGLLLLLLLFLALILYRTRLVQSWQQEPGIEPPVSPTPAPAGVLRMPERAAPSRP